ncbi:cation-translocating P-type ATPase [Actinomarinicola tropica]|uniref:HAD-IC family P-type ATPase n=1 Tax=Actinomarinicola tropica TaxID=2789776 RepID=A0A5Q2RNE7_9ACTN|nr:HAD-IC family P-type ATPase [Actinomarinicola tropica]QGG95420.1 HAD-IC family P-type ATPase [Actinomarinicola tropica]
MSTPWHALEADDVVGRLGTDGHGLSHDEAAARLERHGPNQLEEVAPPSALLVLLGQFRSPLIFILLLAFVVTVLLDELLDAAVIAAVLLLNAVIGFTQERKAEGAVRALMQLVVPHARVVRDGRDHEVDSRDLVPGDVVLLESGVRVPADIRLLSVNALQVDESLLTGESASVTKALGPVEAAAPIGDRRCMAFTGSTVTAGRGSGVAVATGGDTELGVIAGLMRGESVVESPLQRRMDSFAKVVGVAVGAAAAVAFASGVLLGESVEEMFMVAVALAVAAIPEGLPIAVTITLAVGVRRMARRHAILRRLPAVETLGSTTVIGSDKTGTLTENRMAVTDIWTPGHRFALVGDAVDGEFVEGDEPAAIADAPALHLTLLTGILTNEADLRWVDDEPATTGDPTEVALLLAGATAGLDAGDAGRAYPLFAEIPFEPARRYSATLRERHGRVEVFAKGAPERIVDMCDEMLSDDGAVPLDRSAVEEAAASLASRGRRVLAFAHRGLAEAPQDPEDVVEPEGLVLVGLQAMIDPPRPGARESVAACQEAGIRVVMITGDHADTARAIAHQLGIGDGTAASVATGADLAGLSPDDLRGRVRATSVFARVSPEDKLRIVRALQADGEVVAVTGDGVNDAPALKAAEIGVAMGEQGTDVARQAAEMVLADDDFVSIVAAVEEGRITFDNIRKVTFFLVSTGAAVVAGIVAAVWLGWPLVMLPTQLLWLNLVTNGVQDVALAFEPGEPDVLRRPPRRPGGGVLDRIMWERVVVTGLVMATGMLVMFRWALDGSGSLEQAQTVALTTMVVFQALQVGNARWETESVFVRSPISNPFLFVATALALALHVAALHLGPTQFVLGVEPIGLDAWVRIVAVASTVVVAMELHKLLRRPRR